MRSDGLSIELTSDLPANREPMLAVYRDAYADKIAADGFFSEQRYWERLEAYGSRAGFSIAFGSTGDQLVGYALGCSLPEGSRWWEGLIEPTDPALTVETGSRTFALTYMMVRHAFRRRGYAKALHDALLSSRSEERATLLVIPDNTPARSAYLQWGWHVVGQLQPFADAPVYDAMLLPSMPNPTRNLKTS